MRISEKSRNRIINSLVKPFGLIALAITYLLSAPQAIALAITFWLSAPQADADAIYYYTSDARNWDITTYWKENGTGTNPSSFPLTSGDTVIFARGSYGAGAALRIQAGTLGAGMYKFSSDAANFAATAQLRSDGGTSTFANVESSGVRWENIVTHATADITGTWTVLEKDANKAGYSAGLEAISGRTLTLNIGTLAGVGDIQVGGLTATATGNYYLNISNGLGYTGMISANRGTLRFNNNADLRNADFYIASGATFDVANDVIVRSISINGIALVAGTYDYTALNSTFSSSVTLLDNGGSMTVIEPVGVVTAWTESFDNTCSSNKPLADYGWRVNYDSNAEAIIEGEADWTRSFAVTAGQNMAATAATDVFSGKPFLLWTDTVSLSSIRIRDVFTFEFTMKNQVASTNQSTGPYQEVSLAVRVDGTWYVSQNRVSSANPDAFSSIFYPGHITWDVLSFTSGVSMARGSATGLPETGTLDAIGIFADTFVGTRVRLLDFSVNAVSESATLLLHYRFNDLTDTTEVADWSGGGISGTFEKQGCGTAALQTGMGISGLAGDYAYNGTSAVGMGTSGESACRIKYDGPEFDLNLSSFTVTGWYKTQAGPIANSARLLATVGTEPLGIMAINPAKLRLSLGPLFVDSDGVYTNAGTWTFFAVTYDSTVPSGNDNVKFWKGDTDSLLLAGSVELAGAGTWDGLGASGGISIGNRTGTTSTNDMNRPFDGFIDDFRLYGSPSGSSGALTEVQLNEILRRKFPEPSLLFTSRQLQDIRTAITKTKEPFKTAWSNLQARCNSNLSYLPDPYTGTDLYMFSDASHMPGTLARDFAMAWNLSGKTSANYAQKASEILYAWASGCLGTPLSQETGTGMRLARFTFPFMCAYDLLKADGLITTQHEATIKAWFQQIADQIKLSVQDWENNDYYNHQNYQNHLIAHTMGLLAIGYVLDDSELFQYAFESEENPRDLIELIEGCILVEGDVPCHREKGGYPIITGEIYDRYRHDTAPLKGLQYSHLTLSLLATSVRMAVNNGIDMAGYMGSGGENLRQPFEFYADFYRLKDSTLYHGYYAGECHRIGKTGDVPGLFELGLYFYPDSANISNLIHSVGTTNTVDRGAEYMGILGYTGFFAKP